MIQLLRTVKQVNAGRIGDNMPPLTGGSREVHRVYASFAKLYKIVRMSNSAFFVGDLTSAHRIGLDALNLFRKIGETLRRIHSNKTWKMIIFHIFSEGSI